MHELEEFKTLELSKGRLQRREEKKKGKKWKSKNYNFFLFSLKGFEETRISSRDFFLGVILIRFPNWDKLNYIT